MFIFPPILFLIFLWFPLLVAVLFFHLIEFGFEKVGIPTDLTFVLLLLILLGSFINIPLTKRRYCYVKKRYFLGLIEVRKVRGEGLFINLGGGIIPLIISFYLIYKIPDKLSILWPVLFMIFICYSLAKVIPERGVVIPAFIPPIFSAFFSIIFCRPFAAPCAFISGVLGTLIGADIMHLPDFKGKGSISIGGAGVFDGIFLTAILSAILAPF